MSETSTAMLDWLFAAQVVLHLAMMAVFASIAWIDRPSRWRRKG